jgi:hypothetical protein
MLDVIAATLGTLGWMAGVLLLVTMALLPLIERLGERRERDSTGHR